MLLSEFRDIVGSASYTWDPVQEDFVDQLTRATRLAFGNSDFDPRPAVRALKGGEWSSDEALIPVGLPVEIGRKGSNSALALGSEKIDEQIELVPIASMRPNPKNAEAFTPRQIRQIAAAIREFGFLNR